MPASWSPSNSTGVDRLDEVASLLDAAELDAIPLAVVADRCPRSARRAPLPAFPTPERAAAAVALAAGRADWLASIAKDAIDDTTGVDASSFVEARRLARLHAGVAADTTWLDPADTFELLAAGGLPVVPWAYARSAGRLRRSGRRHRVPVRRQGRRRRRAPQGRRRRRPARHPEPAAAADSYREFAATLRRPAARGRRPGPAARPHSSCWSASPATPRSARSSSSARAESKPICALTASCSWRRSPGPQPGAPSRAFAWPRCSTASAAGPSSRSTPWSISSTESGCSPLPSPRSSSST